MIQEQVAASGAQERYCVSRFQTVRRRTRPVKVGDVVIGGDNPLIVQSMTTSPTRDVDATVRQSIALAEAGCQVVRITAQNVKAAEALGRGHDRAEERKGQRLRR